MASSIPGMPDIQSYRKEYYTSEQSKFSHLKFLNVIDKIVVAGLVGELTPLLELFCQVCLGVNLKDVQIRHARYWGRLNADG